MCSLSPVPANPDKSWIGRIALTAFWLQDSSNYKLHFTTFMKFGSYYSSCASSFTPFALSGSHDRFVPGITSNPPKLKLMLCNLSITFTNCINNILINEYLLIILDSPVGKKLTANGRMFLCPPLVKEGTGGFYEHLQNPPEGPPLRKGDVKISFNINIRRIRIDDAGNIPLILLLRHFEKTDFFTGFFFRTVEFS